MPVAWSNVPEGGSSNPIATTVATLRMGPMAATTTCGLRRRQRHWLKRHRGSRRRSGGRYTKQQTRNVWLDRRVSWLLLRLLLAVRFAAVHVASWPWIITPTPYSRVVQRHSGTFELNPSDEVLPESIWPVSLGSSASLLAARPSQRALLVLRVACDRIGQVLVECRWKHFRAVLCSRRHLSHSPRRNLKACIQTRAVWGSGKREVPSRSGFEVGR